MKTIILFISIFLFVTACGDDYDSRLTDSDVTCLKILQYGGSCGGTSSTSTVTVTETSSSTATATITVSTVTTTD